MYIYICIHIRTKDLYRLMVLGFIRVQLPVSGRVSDFWFRTLTTPAVVVMGTLKACRIIAFLAVFRLQGYYFYILLVFR